MHIPASAQRATNKLRSVRAFTAIGGLALLLLAFRPVESPVPVNAAIATVVTVNAASYGNPLAPDAIAAAFGAGLAPRVIVAAGLPLPTELNGITVRVVDSRDVLYRARLFFVSPGQINYLIPEQAAVGPAEVFVTHGQEIVARGEIQIASASPALFTFSSNGRGVPTALTTFDGQTFAAVINSDGAPRVIGQSALWQPNYLLLFGTGFRNAPNLRVKIGGVEVRPLYAGPQGVFSGLDQVNLQLPPNLPSGLVDLQLVTENRTSNTVQLRLAGEALVPSQQLPFGALTQTEVQTIIAQAVARAQQIGLRVTIAVLDREGNILGLFKMAGARSDIRIGATDLRNGQLLKPRDFPDGLNDITLPFPIAPAGILREAAALAAISKAGTGAFFGTFGNAFSTRSASFIIQEHLPPLIRFSSAGPLFGVQFSSLLCSDVNPKLPLGLAGDPGGLPLYKGNVAVGGIGIEGDGFYSIDIDPSDEDQAPEEIIALAGTQGFEAPAAIRGDQIYVDGVRLPYLNARPVSVQAQPFASLAGTVLVPPQATPLSNFVPLTLGGVPGRVVPNGIAPGKPLFPFRDSPLAAATKLTAADVTRIITQAAQQANRTRAAIRRPLGSPAEVNISVVDTEGNLLGTFSTIDAPIFGLDVSSQKARTAAFFTNPTAGAQLRALDAFNTTTLNINAAFNAALGQNVGTNIAKFANAAAADGINLDGRIAISSRAQGSLERPFFPDGQDSFPPGPFSKPINVFSPFNNGFQIAVLVPEIARLLTGGVPNCNCITGLRGMNSGFQIFAGAVPLYKNNVFVGAIGISGDGIDQDDLIASTGSVGFEAPEQMRADQVFVRTVRLPYVKFPRHPNN